MAVAAKSGMLRDERTPFVIQLPEDYTAVPLVRLLWHVHQLHTVPSGRQRCKK